jgi:thioredoxin reductase (NADPH)
MARFSTSRVTPQYHSFLVVSGELDVVRPLGTAAVKTLVRVLGSGQFTGEVGILSGRRTLFRVRATKPGRVIELDRQHMLALMQSDADWPDPDGCFHSPQG